MDSEEERELFGSEHDIDLGASKAEVQNCVLDLVRYLLYSYIHDGAPHAALKQKYERAHAYIDFVRRKLDARLVYDIRRRIYLPEQENLAHFLHALQLHEELHVRHTRINPAKPRTMGGVAEDTSIYSMVDGRVVEFHSDTRQSTTPKVITWKDDKVINVVSKEEDALQDALEKHYRTLIVHPRLDNPDHALSGALEAQLEAPFGVVLNHEWSQLLLLYHSIWHFEAYVNATVVGTIDTTQLAQLMEHDWEHNWRALTGRFHDKPISNYSRQNSVQERVVAETAKARDLFWQTWHFLTQDK